LSSSWEKLIAKIKNNAVNNLVVFIEQI